MAMFFKKLFIEIFFKVKTRDFGKATHHHTGPLEGVWT